MRLLKITYHSYPLIAILVLLFGIIACKDFEDCRSIYTNIAWIEFKGENTLAIDDVYFEEPSKNILYNGSMPYEKKSNIDLSDLKDKQLPIPLHPKKDMVSILFYQTQPDPTNLLLPDTLTLFYKRVISLLSPSCGLQQEYVLDSIKTSFAKSTIIKPALRNKYYEKYEEAKKSNVEIYY